MIKDLDGRKDLDAFTLTEVMEYLGGT